MLQNKKIGVKIGYINHNKLQFFSDNPRIYSIVRMDEKTPDQQEIQKQLIRMDHVKSLLQDIKSNGGLIDPIIVRDGIFDVLEGNSRLAAYRALSEKDPIKWGEIKCILLPANITDSEIFALLGQYHIKGKKDWAPYEQAGFMYRRHKKQNIAVALLGAELGIGKKDAATLITTYEFMLEKEDNDLAHWSYYYEYIKSTRIKKLRKTYSALDTLIPDQIRNGEIAQAKDIRDKLTALEKAPKKIVNKFLSKAITLYDAYESLEASGNVDEALKKIKKFREWLVLAEKRTLSAEEPVLKKIQYEMGKLNSQCQVLDKKFQKALDSFKATNTE